MTLEELLKELAEGEPVALSDDELIEIAYAVVNELRQRMPRYAFELGDLPKDNPLAVLQMSTAEDALSSIESMRYAWGREVTGNPPLDTLRAIGAKAAAEGNSITEIRADVDT